MRAQPDRSLSFVVFPSERIMGAFTIFMEFSWTNSGTTALNSSSQDRLVLQIGFMPLRQVHSLGLQ